jgi:hypothetical protein
MGKTKKGNNIVILPDGSLTVDGKLFNEDKINIQINRYNKIIERIDKRENRRRDKLVNTVSELQAVVEKVRTETDKMIQHIEKTKAMG